MVLHHRQLRGVTSRVWTSRGSNSTISAQTLRTVERLRPVPGSDPRPCFSPPPRPLPSVPLALPSAPSLPPSPHLRPLRPPPPPRSVSLRPRRPPGARPQARGRRPGVRPGWALSWRLGRRGERQLFAISRGPRRPRPSLLGWGPPHPHLWGAERGGKTPETSRPVSEGVFKGDPVGRSGPPDPVPLPRPTLSPLSVLSPFLSLSVSPPCAPGVPERERGPQPQTSRFQPAFSLRTAVWLEAPGPQSLSGNGSEGCGVGNCGA